MFAPGDGGARLLAVLDGTTEEQATLDLAALIEHLGNGVARFDEQFARTVARTLHERAPYLGLPVIDAMGVSDVVATLYMDRELRLVVTAHHAPSQGAFSMRWDERHFTEVKVRLSRSERPDPYTFATLDFSVRGKKARLTAAHAPLPVDQTVTLRALATIGGVVEYRVTGLGVDLSVPPESVELL